MRSVAQTLKESLRGVAKAYRVGGEEFVLIFPECEAETVWQIAERARLAVEVKDCQLGGKKTAKVTTSLVAPPAPVMAPPRKPC